MKLSRIIAAALVLAVSLAAYRASQPEPVKADIAVVTNLPSSSVIGSANSVSLSSGLPSIPVGNTIILMIGWQDVASTVTGCTDNASTPNTYHVELTSSPSASPGAAICTARVTAADPTTITATFAGNVVNPTVTGILATGIVPPLALERGAANSGSSASADSGATNFTIHSHVILVGIVVINSGVTASIGDLTNGTSNQCAFSGSTYTGVLESVNELKMGYCIVDAIGEYHAASTLGASAQWTAVVGAFTAEVTTGTLEVRKFLWPSSDNGRFSLWIDGAVKKANAGNGGTTGEVEVEPGTHSVKETGSNLSRYNSAIICREENGTGAVVASRIGTGPLNVQVDAGDDIVCLIQNFRKPGS